MIFLFFRNLLFYYQAYCFDITAIISEIKLWFSQSLTCLEVLVKCSLTFTNIVHIGD